jgi:hypothetical protein
LERLQHHTKTLQLTEIGIVTTLVILGPGMNEVAMETPSAQTPSWHETASKKSTVPFAAPAVPIVALVIFVI